MFSYTLTEILQEAGKQESSSMSQVLRFSAAGQEAWRRRFQGLVSQVSISTGDLRHKSKPCAIYRRLSPILFPTCDDKQPDLRRLPEGLSRESPALRG